MPHTSDWYRQEETLVAELSRGGPGPGIAVAIPGYEDLCEISRGGQGIVYSALQRSTKRRVAVKVLLESALLFDSHRRRFEREIDLAAGLRHPHIVRVYDSGTISTGRQYYVMDLIEGKPLDAWLAEAGSRSIRDLLRRFSRICEAVHYAHQRGVIHRDLKPANILIDDRDEPHILDFGVAKPSGRSTGESGHVSVTGGFLGTLAYASPEQVSCDPSQVDVRTDVYALGMILYEMLAGCSAYPTDGSVADTIRAITEAQPLAPSAAARANRRGKRRGFGPDLDTIAQKSLAKEPARRYQSADSLRRDIEHYLAGEPIEAKRDRPAYVLRKLVLRHKLSSALVAALLAATVIFGAGMSVLYRRARVEAAKAQQIRVFLEDTLASVEPERPGEEVTVRQLLDEALHWVDSTLAGQPEVEAAVRATIGNSYRAIRAYDAAEQQLTMAMAIRRDLFGVDDAQVADSLGLMGLLRRDQGRHAEAEAFFLDGLKIRVRLFGQTHPAVATSLSNLGVTLRAMGRMDEARQALEEALSIVRANRGERHADTAMCQFQLAELVRMRGDLGAAEALHRAALEGRRASLHPRHPDIQRSLLALAGVLKEVGRSREAEALLDKAPGH